MPDDIQSMVDSYLDMIISYVLHPGRFIRAIANAFNGPLTAIARTQRQMKHTSIRERREKAVAIIMIILCLFVLIIAFITLFM